MECLLGCPTLSLTKQFRSAAALNTFSVSGFVSQEAMGNEKGGKAKGLQSGNATLPFRRLSWQRIISVTISLTSPPGYCTPTREEPAEGETLGDGV